MSLAYAGELACSGVNLGLNASIPGFGQQTAQFTVETSKLGASLLTQADYQLNFPPNIPAYLAGFALLDVATLTSALNPLNWVVLNVDANLDLVAELGLVDAKITIVADIAADLSAGISAGSLTGWTYAGRAAGFGRQLAAATRYGFEGAGPDDDANAIVIATGDFGAWVSFSLGFNTGDTADAELAETTTQEQLKSLGTLSGGQWNTKALEVWGKLDAFLLELQGLKASIETQMELTVGIGLPDPLDLLELEVDLDAALADLVSAQLDLGAQIDFVDAKAALLLDLVAELNAQLAIEGLHVWNYSGTASGLGSSFASAISDGLPGGDGPGEPIYGVAIACASPSAWAAFGNIFITG